MRLTILLACLPLALPAQDAISLKDAVNLALHTNYAIRATAAGESAAGSRVAQARGDFLPKVNYSESWTRSDNPVFVFSSLLSQHQFSQDNFQIGPLNRPDFLNNFESIVTADQTIFDAGKTKQAVRGAGLAKQVAGEEHRQAEMEVIAAVVRAYYAAVLGVEQVNAAKQARQSAEADLRRARSIHEAGMSTDSDVLSIRVHLAAVEEQQIRRSADLDVARAALNDVLSLPLDAAHELTSRLSRAATPDITLADYEQTAVTKRPEARQSQLAANLAETRVAESRSSLWPQVTAHLAFEADRQRFYDRGGADWLASIGMHWNLFSGGSERARIQENEFLATRTQAERERTGSGIRMQVRRAYADLRAAEQRIEVAKASVAEAEESLRITQNRYEAGMGNVTELLRTETAVLESRTRYLAAVHDQRLAATALELASGRLSVDSEVLN